MLIQALAFTLEHSFKTVCFGTRFFSHPSREKRNSFTIYDLRFTICKIRRAKLAESRAGATRNFEGGARAWLESGDGAWRRLCTMYDLGNSASTAREEMG